MTNLETWKKLQEDNYFDTHPRYKNLSPLTSTDVQAFYPVEYIQQFTPISPEWKVLVIGCGIGLDIVQIAPHIKEIWGVDVNDTVLEKASRLLQEAGINNFQLRTVETWKEQTPNDFDLVFSITVMQHLSRDLVIEYFQSFQQKLKHGGKGVIQFLERSGGDRPDKAEPSFSWKRQELRRLIEQAGLVLLECKTIQILNRRSWHWLYFRKDS